MYKCLEIVYYFSIAKLKCTASDRQMYPRLGRESRCYGKMSEHDFWDVIWGFPEPLI